MADLIFDTDVLIDAARRDPTALAFVQLHAQQSVLAVSAITQMELLVGCRNKAELRKLERFLLIFQPIRLNEIISDLALDLMRQYRLSHGLLILDALIASTCLSLNTPLVTKNRRDFQFISGLQLFPFP